MLERSMGTGEMVRRGGGTGAKGGREAGANIGGGGGKCGDLRSLRYGLGLMVPRPGPFGC